MDYYQAILLALVQGITEFLPISSSAHLILANQLLGWGTGSLAFDIAVHTGTLSAVLFHFRHELQAILTSNHSPSLALATDHNLFLLIVIATLPVMVVGGLYRDLIEIHLRSSEIIALATIVFALLLWFADWRRSQTDAASLSVCQAFIIGIAQACALIPGTSRAGITITAALLLGLSRRQALNFSFLLAIPVIAAASGLNLLEIMQGRMLDANLWGTMVVGFVVSAVFALYTMKLFIYFVDKIGMLPFVIYRLVLGVILLLIINPSVP